MEDIEKAEMTFDGKTIDITNIINNKVVSKKFASVIRHGFQNILMSAVRASDVAYKEFKIANEIALTGKVKIQKLKGAYSFEYEFTVPRQAEKFKFKETVDMEQLQLFEDLAE